MRIKDLVILHKNVVHGKLNHSEKCQQICNAHPDESKTRYSPKHCQVCKEEIWIRKYPYDTLQAVCADCFSNPNSFVEKDDLIDFVERPDLLIIYQATKSKQHSDLNFKQTNIKQISNKSIKRIKNDSNNQDEKWHIKLPNPVLILVEESGNRRVFQPWWQVKAEVERRGFEFTD